MAEIKIFLFVFVFFLKLRAIVDKYNLLNYTIV